MLLPQGCVDSQESPTGEDRPKVPGTTNKWSQGILSLWSQETTRQHH
jgi:hypothetical protein